MGMATEQQVEGEAGGERGLRLQSLDQLLASGFQLPANGWQHSVHPLDQQHLIVVVDLVELDFDNFAAAGGYGFAYVGRLNGQLAMATIDQHGQLHATRAAVVEEGLERGTDGAARVKHVVAEHNVAALDVESDGAGGDDGAHVVG